MTTATPPSLQDARWAGEISAALGIDEIATAGGSGPEIVTAISPRMMTRPVTEPPDAPSASCQTTDDTATAQVGDMVTVEHRGICDRVATGMITKRDLEDKYEGDPVATIAGKPVTVGGTVPLSPADVGALPASTTAASLGITPGTCRITLPSVSASQTLYIGFASAPPSTYSQSWCETARGRIADLYTTLNQLVEAVQQLSASQCTCNGCAKHS